MDVYPTLTYRDVEAALAWLANAYGLESRVFDGGSADEIHHAVLMHGEAIGAVPLYSMREAFDCAPPRGAVA